MEKKETTRDKKGRFTKKAGKVDVEIHVEPKPEEDLLDLICVSKGEYEQLKLERDAFKATAERMSGKYLDSCQEIGALKGELKSYKDHWERLAEVAHSWRERAMREKDMYVDTIDAFRILLSHFAWLRENLSWTKCWKYRNELVEMDEQIERLVEHLEGLDRE